MLICYVNGGENWKNKKVFGKKLLGKKYIKGKPISTVKHWLDDSPIWSDLLKIRQVYLSGRQVHVKNGKNTLAWEDV